MADDQGEKTEEPSQYKIDESRKKGDVASSKELASVLILTSTLVTLVLSSVYIFETLATYIEWLYGLDVTKAYQEELGRQILSKSMLTLGKCVAPVLVVSLCIGILGQIGQIGILYAPDVLQLKFDRIDPLKGFKRIFSMRALVEAVKSIFKFAIVLAITYTVVHNNMDSFTGFLHAETGQAMAFGKQLALKLAMTILLGLFVVAIGDFAYEKFSYRNKLRMTKQEVKEESKQRDGSPEIKQKIRQIQREMANKRMMADIKKADVIITNPTHLSIVVRYDKNTMIAPEVVGKGADHLALRIREIAKVHDIPIVENVPLARALYKTVKVGEGIPRTLYKAVAEILAFVYRLKKKKKALN